MLLHRTTVFVKNELLRGRGPDHCRAPPQVGRAPMGPAGVAAIGAEHKGFETALGVCEITDGIFTRPGEVAHGFIVPLRDIDRSESAGAREARQLPRVPAVGFDSITRLFGKEGGRHPPAGGGFWPEIPLEPVATGARLRDQDELFAFGLHLPDELLAVTRACPDGVEGDAFGVVCLGDVRHGNRLFPDIQSEVKRARLVHG